MRAITQSIRDAISAPERQSPLASFGDQRAQRLGLGGIGLGLAPRQFEAGVTPTFNERARKGVLLIGERDRRFDVQGSLPSCVMVRPGSTAVMSVAAG
ncbi:hypothetical protein [Amaricoccus sp. W119]|uniref:hypothetical protein n=1 Tax=Amaricoccus sp. W119 TaxID=3391833 RepID=UPI0039A488E5